MNNKYFANLIREKRISYGISQKQLSAFSGISCHYISDIETGKAEPAQAKLDALLDALEKMNPDMPLTIMIDYIRIRFPSTNAINIIEGLMHIKIMYMLHEDYGFYSYDEQYTRGDITVLVSHDEKKGILLELKGKGCRQFEGTLLAQSRNWYSFLQEALTMGGVMKRIDLAVNDHTGILDVGKLSQKCENEECISVFRRFKCYRSGELSCSALQEQNKAEMGSTLYIGSMKSEIYFCIYEKDYEQYIKKGTALEDAPIKNRFEIRLKNQRAALAVNELLANHDAGRTAFAIINRYIRFVDKDDALSRECWKLNKEWSLFIDNHPEQLKLTTKPEPFTLERTLNWLSHQVAPTLKTLMKIDELKGTSQIEQMLKQARLTEHHKKLIEQATMPIEEIIIKEGV